MENSFEIAVEKVINFWVEKAFKTKINQNNGDNSTNGGLIFMWRNMVSSKCQNGITEIKIEKFKTKLRELLNFNKNAKYRIVLDVDYHPCQLLKEALKFAEIEEGCLPCKSHTQIDMETFEVYSKYGYGSDFIKL